jgi:hypothetical protein
MRVHPSLSLGKWLGLGCFLALCGVSCSSSKSALNPVQGKVLYKDQPVAGALVTFHPKGDNNIKTIRPVGLTKEDGTFTLTSGQDEGALAGDYVVTFICSEPVGGLKTNKEKIISTAPPETQDRFQGAYSNAVTSKYNVVIKAGPNQLEPFKLQ